MVTKSKPQSDSTGLFLFLVTMFTYQDSYANCPKMFRSAAPIRVPHLVQHPQVLVTENIGFAEQNP